MPDSFSRTVFFADNTKSVYIIEGGGKMCTKKPVKSFFNSYFLFKSIWNILIFGTKFPTNSSYNSLKYDF